MRIGVDTGGTFTDCVTFDGSEVRILKVFTTSDDPSRGILDGVRQLAGASGQPGGRIVPTRPLQPLDIIHGTTVGTNSLLERRGARVALVTTAGFEDLIEIGRQNRPKLYDLDVHREPPLVPRALRWGINERVAADGTILRRPGSRELERLVAGLLRARPEAVALCLLFSYANPANELAVARALGRLRVPVSISHQILPEFREYERLSAIVINAFLAPRLGAYLRALERAFRRESDVGKNVFRVGKSENSGARLYVMQSSGGITSAERASREPVRTILSGPAGGVVASHRLAERLGIRKAISFDMGGTSTDVCLLDGPPRTTRETTLGGLPVAVPVLDVHSVGAGGGSIARLDAGGALRVGPESAGASPGPISYGRGGMQPTVTDANLILGRLDADNFLGGSFKLDASLAKKGFEEFIRRDRVRLSRSGFHKPEDLARGIVAVSNATMERALRVISVERGYDPRDFTLICFGGAGGLHAADLARSLGLREVVVPLNAGGFSALGILLSDIIKDVSHSVLLSVPLAAAGARRPAFASFLQDLERRFDKLELSSIPQFRRDHGGAKSNLPVTVERWIDLRYAGQAYELSIPFSKNFPSRFESEHVRAYGYAHSGRPQEIVSIRLRLTLRTPKPEARRGKAEGGRNARDAIGQTKPVWFGGRPWQTHFYQRERLCPGSKFTGPAVVLEYSSTTVVPPDCVCRVDSDLNLRLSLDAT